MKSIFSLRAGALLASTAGVAVSAGALLGSTTTASAAVTLPTPVLSQLEAQVLTAGPATTGLLGPFCIANEFLAPGGPIASLGGDNHWVTDNVEVGGTATSGCDGITGTGYDQGLVAKVTWGANPAPKLPAEGVIGAETVAGETFITITSYPFPKYSAYPGLGETNGPVYGTGKASKTVETNAGKCYSTGITNCEGSLSVWANNVIAGGDGNGVVNLLMLESAGTTGAATQTWTRFDDCTGMTNTVAYTPSNCEAP